MRLHSLENCGGCQKTTVLVKADICLWRSWTATIGQVDEAVNSLLIQLNLHIGGKWRRGARVRQFYYNYELKEPRPTKKDIALRLPEWIALFNNCIRCYRKPNRAAIIRIWKDVTLFSTTNCFFLYLRVVIINGGIVLSSAWKISDLKKGLTVSRFLETQIKYLAPGPIKS